MIDVGKRDRNADEEVRAVSGTPGSDGGDPQRFPLSLEPDFCCGGGHCGPLPGYTFVCPSCGKDSGCRTGDYLEVGETLTCFLCQREMRAVEQLGEFEYLFTYADRSGGASKE